jgi:hypothetical protein
MKIIETLLDTASQDTQLLIANDNKGDNFSIPRDIDFVIYAEEEKKASTVTNFINDHRYGLASFEKIDDQYRILIVINMPSTQSLICSVSALMACIASLFSVKYDGWGCNLQNK